MSFTRIGNIYRVTRITGWIDKFLGIVFADSSEQSEQTPEVIEVEMRNSIPNKNPVSKDEVVKQVLSGLEAFNRAAGTNYKVSKIFFAPSFEGRSPIFEGLTYSLVGHYHRGGDFREILPQ